MPLRDGAAILQTGTVPLRLKELVIVRTSQLNRCEYCLSSHTQICLRLGWTREQLDNLADFANRDDFTAAEKAALRLAEQMTLDANRIPDAEFRIGKWDPYSFIAFCERARAQPVSSQEMAAMEIQRAEWQILFDYCARPQ